MQHFSFESVDQSPLLPLFCGQGVSTKTNLPPLPNHVEIFLGQRTTLRRNAAPHPLLPKVRGKRPVGSIVSRNMGRWKGGWYRNMEYLNPVSENMN
ncbi:hypothetical protein AVEN_194796-1 [Araneus ventricosus]|uniref:Uncharacterized protein n=1 Tax=Araneus ventricosus TaxID=182803 RepID=A0A4Y2B3G4_ARAVE|nr:hypothetical protein AVEN_194796-1 [Araneus ventricosus]